MALNAALDIGIKGSAAQKTVAGQITVIAVRHSIETPRDPKTGMPKGKPVHGPLVITKPVDLASTGIREAMASGKLIGKGTLQYWRLPPVGGQEEAFASFIFFGAQIVGIRHVSLNNAYPEFNLTPDHEEVSFIYKSATWKYHGTEREGSGNTSKVNSEGNSGEITAAPDELNAWAREMVLGSGEELKSYVRDTVKARFASLLSELKGGTQEKPPE